VSPKAKLLLIAAVCVAPAALAWLVYLSGWSLGTRGNYGELLPPRPVNGRPLEALRGRWVLVSFDASACDAYCEKKLYFMRQARRAQGKEMGRIERLWLLTDGGKPRPELLAAIEDTHVASFGPAGFPGNVREHIYVVDPLGNLMMRFPKDPDPSRIIKDLQRLLKVSRIG
jgi:hypothetical protein